MYASVPFSHCLRTGLVRGQIIVSVVLPACPEHGVNMLKERQSEKDQRQKITSACTKNLSADKGKMRAKAQ